MAEVMQIRQPPPPPPSDELAVPVAVPVSAPVPTPTPIAVASQEKDTEVELGSTLEEFLLSSHYSDSIKSVREEFKLSEEDDLLISDFDRLVLAGQLDLDSYLVAIDDEFGKTWKPEDLKRLEAKLLAERFVPLGDSIKPSAIETAKSVGLVLPFVSHYQIYTKPLTFSGAATEVAATVGFSLMGATRERLRELIVSRVKGVRVDSQVLETLSRGADFGGLGLDKGMAEKTLVAMKDILSRATVISEDEYGSWLSREAREKTNVEYGMSNVGGKTEDEKEIESIQAKMQVASTKSATELDSALEATFARVAYRPPSEYLTSRLRNAISSRLRDVRSAEELRQLFRRDTKVGGLSLDQAQSEAIAKTVEESYKEFHDRISTEEKQKIDRQLSDQQRKIEERRRREAEEHAKWYEERVRQRKDEEAKQKTTTEEFRQSFARVPVSPLEHKERRIELEKYGELVPAPASRMVQPFDGSLLQSPVKTERPGVSVSKATVEISKVAVTARPSVDAVRHAAEPSSAGRGASPQLYGLIGELGSLSIAEFRRLAKSPEDAVKKISQKIEILGQESFEKRLEGIRAYQASPFQASYVALVAESFRQARQVAELAEEKRAAGGDALSPDEIAAIVSFNSTLHF